MYFKYIAILILFACFQLKGQNSLSNPSFENGSCPPESSYSPAAGTGLGTSFENCLNVWEACGKSGAPNTSHSPDWFQSGTIGVTAAEGSRFVHMVQYEAIQQKLPNELIDKQYYWISLRVHLNSFLLFQRDFSTAALNIYLGGSSLIGNQRFEYESDPDPNTSPDPCEAAYRELDAPNKTLLKQIDLSNYPLDEWVQIQFIFQYNGLAKRDLLAIELIDTEAENKVLNCTRGSICLDDIVFTGSICSHPCAPVLPPIEYLSSNYVDGEEVVEIFHDEIIIDHDSKVTCARIKNANDIEFQIYDRWGNVRYHRRWFDVNGLRNYPLSNDRIFIIGWNGEDDNGGYVSLDVYTYTIWLRSCQGEINSFTGQLIYADFSKGSGVPTYPFAWIPDPLDVNCCNPGGLVIQDPIDGGYRANYEGAITIGPNASFSGSGVQIISSGEAIDLFSDVVIAPETSFDAFIMACEDESVSGKKPFEKDESPGLVSTHEFYAYPNPTNIYCFIKSDDLTMNRIRVTDVHGAVLVDEHVYSMEMLLNIENFQSGLYFVHITDVNQAEHILKIVKQ
jgi:hypothetical protein